MAGTDEKIKSNETETTVPDKSGGEDDSKDDSNDLVIREGFPALRIPGTQGKPLIDGEEPIPRHTFWSSENVIDFHPQYLENLRADCETVFSARDKPDGQAYSTGQTFFLPATMKPRCALEAFVLTIFERHVEHLDKDMFKMSQSGAEWWTLVLDDDEDKTDEPRSKNDGEEEEDEEDEVALHFDADYELEEQATNLLLHPRLATVTYLSDFGAPTLIIDKKSPPPNDIKKSKLEEKISRAWLSHPKIGKHTAFDGRLLHGAPALFFPSQKRTEEEPQAKRQKISRKRITLLVNIWLNHWVMDAALLDDEVCAKLATPFEPPSNLKGDDSYKPPFKWNQQVDLSKPATVEKVSLTASKVDPAGEEEFALCNHCVTIKFGPTMEELHKASAAGSIVEMALGEGALSLHVGEELADESSDEEEGEGDLSTEGKKEEKP
jgi:hypothetical protein